MKLLLVLALGLAAVTAVPYGSQRIVGGSPTTIEEYPYAAVLLFRWPEDVYEQGCGGTIINNRSVMSAAHCFVFRDWTIRVGSTYANSGGVIHNIQEYLIHPQYNSYTIDKDIALLRSTTAFQFGPSVRAGSIAGVDYDLPDNTPVWAIGWGRIYSGGPPSEELRHVQIWTVNQETCAERYASMRATVTANMLCSGWLDVGGRDQCVGDSGSPLIHNNVVVGVCSWGAPCGQARYPGVNVRVSRFTPWILANA